MDEVNWFLESGGMGDPWVPQTLGHRIYDTSPSCPLSYFLSSPQGEKQTHNSKKPDGRPI